MVNAFIFFHLTRLNFLQVVNLNYGMKDKNPIDFVRFYTKENPNVAIEVKKDEVLSLKFLHNRSLLLISCNYTLYIATFRYLICYPKSLRNNEFDFFVKGMTRKA